ncbi:MAG: phospholipase D-like domain-containing protein [Halofilum sp. (in: g-proteobacteria)]|nr:phospholipase D-like domain-containing protein [Halofilum sp. (in: g-proteobacteria)]
MLTLLYTIVLALIPLLALASAGHALLYKRDPRSAFGWIAVCVMFPLAGPLLYFVFGINRVRTRAQRLSRRFPFALAVGYERGEYERVAKVVSTPELPERWQPLARISEGIGVRPLLGGNRIEALHNGEAAYPEMLAAIGRARYRVWLATYIFETNRAGRRFIDALSDARRRGVEVHVLLDGLGELYSWPWAGRLLRRQGVPVARFMRPGLWPPSLHLNLRNHRKVLVVDGGEAFVGGMNIGDRHLVEDSANAHRVVDLHFRVAGPVATQVATIFAEDWQFATGQALDPAPPEPIAAAGDAVCRAFSDGPNEDLGRLATVLTGAVNAARTRIDIMTPYFIPPAELLAALQSAALRGVHVRILLPGRSNLPYVQWATQNLLWELLQFGVEVRYQPPPFVHSKLFVVDGHYALVGSANLDPRSLRLNFELAVELFGSDQAAPLAAHCEAVAAHSRAVTLAEVDARPLPVRARDAVCWLFSPYL